MPRCQVEQAIMPAGLSHMQSWSTEQGLLLSRIHLKSPRPVPFALGRPDAQLKAAVSIVPVEGRLHSWGQLPHQVGVALPILQRLAAVVE